MPKIIPIIEKREWLRLYEEGKSVTWIAEQAKRNVKTVKRGIDDARRERDGQLARSELIRGALQKHQDQLMAIVNDILSAVQPPTLDLELDLPILLPGAKVTYEETKGLVLVLNSEGRLEWEMLREHLGKSDRLWGLLDQWKKTMTNHIQAQRELRLKAENIIKFKTGQELTKDTKAPPFVYASAASTLRVEALYIALETPPPTKLEECITVDTETGEVRYESNRILAKAPGEEEEYKRNIISAFTDIQKLNELKKAAKTYKEVGETETKLRRPVEEIVLLGIVPGQCRVCRRLGI